MALPGIGSPIGLLDLQTEFGGANPIGINEYYRGGAYVPSNTTVVPASGKIELDDFLGFAISPAFSIGQIITGMQYAYTGSPATGVGVVFDRTYTVPNFTSPAQYRVSWSITASAAYGYTENYNYVFVNGVAIYLGRLPGGSTLGGTGTWYRDNSGTRTGNFTFTIQGGDVLRYYAAISTRSSNDYTPNHTAMSGSITRVA